MTASKKKKKTTTAPAGKKKAKATGARKPGRPARLSREDIIAISVALLEEEPVENFTLARVAKKLDTVSMALYNYFDSREALLCAVADHICMGFAMPRSRGRQSWQNRLRAWLNAVRDLAEQHPVILKVLGVDGQTTAGWLRVTLTVCHTLHEEGMRGKQLAINSYHFCSQAVALLMFESMGANFHSSMSLSHLDELEPEEQNFLLELRPYHASLTTDEILAKGFNQMLRELELELSTLEGQA
jgi:AcrR family transcriptional regulator